MKFTLSKTGRFLSKAEILGVGVFPPLSNMYQSRFSGRGWGQQLFSSQSPAVQWMARTSSLNCLSCRNPYQAPDSLNCLPPFHWKPFFSVKSASSHPFPKIGSECIQLFSFPHRALQGVAPKGRQSDFSVEVLQSQTLLAKRQPEPCVSWRLATQ